MYNHNTQRLNISTSAIVRFFAVILGLGLIYLIRDIIADLLFAIIIASALEPAVEWLKKRKIPRILSVILIYLVLAALFFFLVYLILPLFFGEFRTFAAAYPNLQKQILGTLEKFGNIPFFADLRVNAQSALEIPSDYIDKLSGGLSGFASGVFGGLFSFILIVVFSFYLTTQEKGIENVLRLVTPLAYEPYIIHLWNRSQKKLGKWMQAQLLLAAIVGVFIFLGLTFLGVENALFFAFISALFEIIPVVGPVLAAVPGVITAFLMAPVTGILAVLLYTAVQQMESHIIVPVVMRKTVGLSPLIVVFALLVGGKVAGIFGMILAIPVTAILAEMIEDWDKKKRSLIPGS